MTAPAVAPAVPIERRAIGSTDALARRDNAVCADQWRRSALPARQAKLAFASYVDPALAARSGCYERLWSSWRNLRTHAGLATVWPSLAVRHAPLGARDHDPCARPDRGRGCRSGGLGRSPCRARARRAADRFLP